MPECYALLELSRKGPFTRYVAPLEEREGTMLCYTIIFI